MKTKLLSLIGLSLVFALVLFSCGGAEEEAAPEPEPEVAEEAVIEEQELETIEIPEIEHALITFITGDAYIIDDGADDGGYLADIGGFLEAGQSLEVETGYAELQIGDIGTVRVREASTVRLDDIVLSTQGSSVDIRVVSGSILNKVERLAGTDSYEVRTETAVMGVRGTQFGVNVDPEGGTRVAVREGRVAMVPPAADPQRIRDRAANAGDAAEAIEATARQLEEQAPVIEANQEVSLDRAAAEEAAVVAAALETTITEIEERAAAGETVDVEEVSVRLNEATEQTTARIQEDTEQKRTEVTEETRQELEEIEEIRYIPLPPPPAEEPEDAADAETDAAAEEAEAQPVAMPVLVPVRLQVQPAGTTISINGRVVGQNRFSGVYQPGERITFELTRDGYRTETLDVTVDPDRGRAYQVQLAEIPQRPDPEPVSLDVSVEPADARIFINDRRRGRGSASDEFEVGDEVTIRAELDGYDTVERSVTIEEGLAPVAISLNRTIAGVRVQAEPDDATISINGESLGTGGVTAEFPIGEEVMITVSREGYETIERTVEVAGTSEPVRFELERLIGTVAISVEPRDAAILIDGRRVGAGSVTEEYPVGTELTVRFERPSYAGIDVPLVVAEGDNVLDYELTRDVGTLSVTAVPSSARILIDGTEVGTGRITQQLPAGRPVTVSVVADGYVTQERTIDVTTGTTPVRFSLERGLVQLRVQAQPTDSRISIDGRSAGSGSVSREFAIGETVRVSATRPGFAPVQRTVQIGAEGASLQLRLEPRPIEQTIPVGDSPWIRGLVSDGRRVYGADAGGTVYAVDPNGRVAWQRPTQNSGNENSLPVVSGGRVAFSGSAELVVLSASSGQVLGRRPLSGPESHLFGRRVVPSSAGWYFPSDDAIVSLNADGGDAGRRISVPGGSKMSAAATGDRLVLADQQGTVVVLNATSGNAVASINTGMTQPVALAPAVSGDTAVFVGRRGTVVAISISSASVLWEEALPGGRGSFVDPVIAGGTVLFLDRDELIGLSLADGSVQYTVSGAAGMPAVDGSTLYVPFRDGSLAAVNAANGQALRDVRLPGAAAGGATMVGERVAVGLADGRIVIVHPAGM